MWNLISRTWAPLIRNWTLFSLSAVMTAHQSAVDQVGLKKDPLEITNEEWKKILPPEKYHVAREQGTERAFTGEYDHHFKPGVYKCTCCGADLFISDHKYNSGCGWPAFHTAHSSSGTDEADSNVVRRPDFSHGVSRVEVICKKCHAHLGHVFDDGPKPTGERFCINSVSLDFVPKTDS